MPRAKNYDDDLVLPLDSPERRRLPLLLRRSWYGLNQAFRRRISHTKVTPDQFTVMRTLMEGDARGMSQNEVASAMSSDPNTIASLIERMQANGLVTRLAHESDRRAHRIKLLPTGKASYDAVRELALQLQSEVLQSIPMEKRDEFLRHLALVADACRASAEGSPKKSRRKPKE